MAVFVNMWLRNVNFKEEKVMQQKSDSVANCITTESRNVQGPGQWVTS